MTLNATEIAAAAGCSMEIAEECAAKRDDFAAAVALATLKSKNAAAKATKATAPAKIAAGIASQWESERHDCAGCGRTFPIMNARSGLCASCTRRPPR